MRSRLYNNITQHRNHKLQKFKFETRVPEDKHNFDFVLTAVTLGRAGSCRPDITHPLPHDTMRSAAYTVVRCLSVCLSVHPSVTFVYYIEKTKHILKLFSSSSRSTILVFPYQML